MPKKHDHSHFIPAPFPVITEYENAFIREWRKNTAKAVTEILHYAAKATADAIKESKK